MSKKREKPGEVRKNKKKFQEQSRKHQAEQESYRKSLQVKQPEQHPIEQFSIEENDYIYRASTHPLEPADFYSSKNHGKKFKNLSQLEEYGKLMERFTTIGLRLLKETDLRGKELNEAIIKEMLQDENLSRVNRAILESKLPGNVR